MVLNHNEYLDYTIPDSWCAEEDAENLYIYDPDGNGAITVSFYSVLVGKESVEEQMKLLAKGFISRDNIILHSPLVSCIRDGKRILHGTGIQDDHWFIKLWIVAHYPKIVVATYYSEEISDEVSVCDSIIDSFQFDFYKQ